MKNVNGIWLPDNEQHLLRFITDRSKMVNGRGTYQYKKIKRAVELCKSFRTAVDVGAHVGLWTMHLARYFDHVECFEPVVDYRQCWARNMKEVDLVDKCSLYKYALGHIEQTAHISADPEHSGDTRIDESGDNERNQFETEMLTLDSFEFENIDLIKIDCEGFELNVLKGGEETILRNKPIIVVEQKPGNAEKFGFGRTEGCTWLENLGAKQLDVIAGDYFYGW